MTTVAFCEVAEFPRRVLAKHWPEIPIYEDIRTITAELLRRDGVLVDVIAGGFPCQPFSTAARGRNNAVDLWGEMHRLVREVRPRWVLAENVPGLRPSGVDRVCADLEGSGYTVWTFDLDTAPAGRHRGRRRLIFVAHANGDGQPRRAVNAEVAKLSAVSRRRWQDDPAPVGMDDGLPGRMDRLAAIGNAITPEAAYRVGRAVMMIERVQ